MASWNCWNLSSPALWSIYQFLGPTELSQLFNASYKRFKLIAADLVLSLSLSFYFFISYCFFLDSWDNREIEDFGVFSPRMRRSSLESFETSAVFTTYFLAKMPLESCFWNGIGDISLLFLAYSSNIFEFWASKLGLIKFLKVSLAKFFWYARPWVWLVMLGLWTNLKAEVSGCWQTFTLIP